MSKMAKQQDQKKAMVARSQAMKVGFSREGLRSDTYVAIRSATGAPKHLRAANFKD